VLVGPLRAEFNNKGELNLTGTGGSTGLHLAITRERDKRWMCAANLVGRELKVDGAARSVTIRGGIPLDEGQPPVPVAWAMRLLDDGALQLEFRQEGGPALAGKARLAISYHGPRPLHQGRAVSVDGQDFVIAALDAPSDQVVPLWNGLPRRVSLASSLPGRIDLDFSGVGSVAINDRRIAARPGGGVVDVTGQISATQAAVAVRLGDFGVAAGAVHAGVDYGRLELPRPAGRNLVLNPGFEQGFRGWDKLSLGRVNERGEGDGYAITDQGAYEGRRCLRIAVEPGVQPVHLACFALPVEAAKPYVLSFWARAGLPDTALEVSSHTAQWAHMDCGKSLRIGTAWTRYQVPFTTSGRLIGIGFASSAGNKQATALFVDAVQVEAGAAASDWLAPPLASVLLTGTRGNLLTPDQAVQAVLRIDGAPGLAGAATVAVSALDGSRRQQAVLPFTIAADGSARLPLPWADRLPRGLTLVDVDLAAGELRLRDHHRIAIAAQPEPRRRHRLLYAGGAFDQRYGNWERWAAFFQHAGVGAHVMFDPVPEGMRSTFAGRGVYFYSAIMEGGENVTLDGTKIELRHRYHELTADQLAAIERMAYDKAKANPAIRHWKTFNEPELIPLLAAPDREQRMRAFVALQRALWTGIKRADPALLVMTPDCSSMYPSTGIAFLDAWFAAGGKEVSDICAVHPYRGRPEDPDLDDHCARLFAMLDRHQFTGEVWFTEGIYHQPWQVPAFALDPHAGCSSDHCRAPVLTYHCAWGERIAAAYTQRSWLAALKYSARVRNSVDWGFPRSYRTLDHDFTPSAAFFASNTLADLLGDATFLRDIEFGAGVRGYLFDDGHGRTVAALWSYDPVRDRGEGVAPLLHLPALPAGSELIACDGAPLPLGGTIAITPEPRFLRCADRAALLAALDAGTFPAGGVAQTHLGVRLAAADRVEVAVRNLLGRSQRGRLTVRSGTAVLHDGEVELAAHAVRTVAVPVAAGAGTFSPVAVEAAFTPVGAAPVAPTATAFDMLAIHRLATPPALDGSLAGWPAAARLTLPGRLVEYQPLSAAERERFTRPEPWKGPEDLSAELYAGWDDQHLYLAVAVRDDVHDVIDEPNRAWQGDSIQLYLDGWGDARLRAVGGYHNDDQALRAWARADGTLAVLRDVAPEQQVAFLKTGPVAGLKGAARRRDDGVTVYELALPLKQVQPLQLKAGTVFGLALLLNDRDRDWRKRALTTTAPGSEPHQHPQRWPAAILVD
jgi:hypothetical protein